ISNVSVPTAVDSISSTFIEKQNKLSVLTQPEITNQSKPIKLGAVGSNVFVQSSSTDQQISNVA
ncbi:unnamed protein product, partial [Rotaria socialis]